MKTTAALLAALAAGAMAAPGATGASAEMHPRDAHLLGMLASYETVQDPLASRRRALRGEAGAAPVDAFQYSLRALGEEHVFDLELFRELFSEDYKHTHVDADGKMTTVSTEKHCIYRGANRTVFSFCGGVVHGRFTRGEEEMHVRPLASGEHIAYRRRDLLEDQTGMCALDDAEVARMESNIAKAGGVIGSTDRRQLGAHDHTHDHAHAHGAHAHAHDAAFADVDAHVRRELRTAELGGSGASASARRLSTNEVELLVFNDHKRFLRFGAGVEADTAYIASLVADLYTELPGPNAIVVKLVGIFTMVDSDPWPSTIVNGGLSVDVSQLLDDFSTYVGTIKNAGPVVPQFDHCHLLSESDFFKVDSGNNGVIGLATLNRLCDDEAAAPLTSRILRSGVTQANYGDQAFIAAVFTHELGHNLGMKHTGETDLVRAPSSPCDNASRPEVMDATAGGVNPAWSSCTHEYWDFNLPSRTCVVIDAATEWEPPVCGNGIREGSEQCDCYLNDCTGVDACCNATDCTLLSGTCSAQDPCCDAGTCMPTANTALVCRPSGDATCDPAPETCDGVNANCPVDVVASAGTACGTGDEGACWLGKCRNLDDQCVALGYPNGACGFQNCGGELKCKNVPNSSGTAPCSSFFTLSFHYPQDGSPCSTGQCYQSACIASGSLPTPADLADCSNGIKDNAETDVDCGGGSCLPCFGGQNCTEDDDCLFPGFCNATLSVCQVTGGNGIRGDGTGGGDPSLQDQVRDLFQKFLDWAKANPAAAGGAGAALFVLLFFCCFGCVCCGGKDKVPKYAKQVKGSFRNMRGGGRGRQDLAPVMTR